MTDRGLELPVEESRSAGREVVLAAPRFSEETRRFLQSRLRLALRIATTSLAAATVLTLSVPILRDGADLLRTFVGVAGSVSGAQLLATLVVAAGLYGLVRGRSLSATTLSVCEGAFLQVSFAVVWVPVFLQPSVTSAVYPLRVGLIILMVLLRAILIPSTAWRTFLLSLPGPLVLLALDVSQGPPLGFSEAGDFARYAALGQVLMITAVIVASVASRVNLTLRRRTWEAKSLGVYRLDERIGRGAMGEIYRATHSLLKRPTAIKFLHRSIGGDENLRRFEKEVVLTSRMTHPNIISIYDYGRTAEGDFYYAMEMLDGLTLRQFVTSHGAMPPARALRVLGQVCDALTAAHEQNLIHRDVKPDNIMLCRQSGLCDVVKVLDFGLVKDLDVDGVPLTRENGLLGTPETMSPEMINGAEVGPQADIYGLAAVGYYISTGTPVFPVATLEELLMAHLLDAPESPSLRLAGVPGDLEACLLRGLEKDPAARFASAAEMLDALAACGDFGKWNRKDAREWWEREGPPAASRP